MNTQQSPKQSLSTTVQFQRVTDTAIEKKEREYETDNGLSLSTKLLVLGAGILIGVMAMMPITLFMVLAAEILGITPATFDLTYTSPWITIPVAIGAGIGLVIAIRHNNNWSKDYRELLDEAHQEQLLIARTIEQFTQEFGHYRVLKESFKNDDTTTRSVVSGHDLAMIVAHLAPNDIEAIHSLVLENPDDGTQHRARLKVRDIGDDMVETTMVILPE